MTILLLFLTLCCAALTAGRILNSRDPRSVWVIHYADSIVGVFASGSKARTVARELDEADWQRHLAARRRTPDLFADSPLPDREDWDRIFQHTVIEAEVRR